jgi:hypothetical protein
MCENRCHSGGPFIPDVGITVTVLPDPILISSCVRNDTLIPNPQVPKNSSWNVTDQTVRDLKKFSAWGILDYDRIHEAMINQFCWHSH